jgi:hypothetical protein
LFASVLNKGFRASIPFIVSVFLLSMLLLYLSSVSLESLTYPDILYNYIESHFRNHLLVTFLQVGFVAIAVYLVDLISINQEISEKQNYFTVFLFMIINLSALNPISINSQLFTNIFVLLALFLLVSTYRREKALNEIYQATFWLGISSIFTISSVLFLPLFFLAILILRPFYWREWAIALVGFILPVVLYEGVAYLLNLNRNYFWQNLALYISSLRVPVLSEYYVPLCVTLFLLLVASFFYVASRGFGNTVKKQRVRSILLWYFLFMAPACFRAGSGSEVILLTLALPVSFFGGDFLYSLGKTKLSNTILTLLMLCSAIIFMGKLGLV